MKTVCETDRCTGCMACKDICSQNAIEIKDSIRAYNAVIDTDKCISCGACYRVCQVNCPISLNKPSRWYQRSYDRRRCDENGKGDGDVFQIQRFG